VFAGVFDRHPDLKIVTHHLGGGMIPFFDGRIGAGMEVLGARTSDEDYSKIIPALKRPHLDYFRTFYADTALFGAGNGLICGLDFFGADRVVFATDAPLGPIAKTLAAIDALDLEDGARHKIMVGNAERLMKMDLAKS
jgi:predicted TIM-barrel fold metal-dependent hydrolase